MSGPAVATYYYLMIRLVALAVALFFAGCGPAPDADLADDAAGDPGSPTPDVGLQLYSLRNELAADPVAGLDSIASWGIRYVEGGNNPTYGLTLDSFKTLLADRDIDMVSVAADYAQLRDSIDVIVAKAKAHTADYVVCFWIPHADTVLTVEEAEGAIEVFNAAGQVLAKAGITLAYHPHGYEFEPHPAGGTVLDELVRRSDHYDFEMDVYWIALPGQDPIEWLRRYPEEWVLMHLKDCERGADKIGTLPHANDTEWNTVLGEGQFPLAEVIREAAAMGIPYLFVEDESLRAMRQVAPSKAYVEAVLAGE